MAITWLIVIRKWYISSYSGVWLLQSVATSASSVGLMCQWKLTNSKLVLAQTSSNGCTCRWHNHCVHQSCPCSWLARWRGVLHEYKVMITMTAPGQQDIIYITAIARVIFFEMWLTMAFESFIKSYRLLADNGIECTCAKTWCKIKASVCNWMVYVCEFPLMALSWRSHSCCSAQVEYYYFLAPSAECESCIQDARCNIPYNIISWNHLGAATCR